MTEFIDCISKRYSNPFEIIDLQFELHRFPDFIAELNNIRTEEQIFDIWLYKCQDKCYEDFRKSIMSNAESSGTGNTKADIEQAVKTSRDVLSEFN